ncbi:MAG: hypothetical protein AB7I37_12185 [Pirellulales bacterium]
MFSDRELATMLAALLYWSEEMSPHGVEIMRPYFDDLELGHVEPLSADEITELMRRMRGGLMKPGPG